MQLLLQRRPTVKATTLGEMFLDGKFFCFTLEDQVREVAGKPVSEWKVSGETAIPAGRYLLELVDSGRFGPDTLSLKNVPGFENIRIHSGNDDADTEGCLLVGNTLLPSEDDGGNILESRAALTRLKASVNPEVKSGRQVWITVKAAQYGPSKA